MEDNTKNKKKSRLLVSPNPIAMASAGLSGAGTLMPDAIHGGGIMGGTPASGTPASGTPASGTPVSEESLKKESSIDYPVSEGLCPQVWDEVEDGKYILNPNIKMKALELVDKLLAKYHVEAKGVNVVGSICSNQYTEDGDVDIHIQVDLPEDVAEKLNNLRKKTQDEILGGENLLVGGSHPLEFYFQSNLYADMGSCGCYDMMNDRWLSGPQLVDLEFDPFEEYSQSLEEAFEYGDRVQTIMFELNKNLYKYNAILDQASNKDVYSNEQLMSLIGRRLEQVSDAISDSMKIISGLKDEMVQVRRRAGLNPKNEQEAEEMRTNKEWLTANSTFKFLQRLGVLDQVWLAATLWNAIEDGDITIQDAILELNR